jgi:malate dehydrogenase (oxaloacetate-decarboxylating)
MEEMSLWESGIVAELHKHSKGKISVNIKVTIENADDLSLAYSPGVAEPCKEIHQDPDKIYDYTIKGNLVAMVSDGSAVLGLGNIGAAASMPVMEGKAALFKAFADIDAFPICLNTNDPEKIIFHCKSNGTDLWRDKPRRHFSTKLLSH